MVVFVAELLLLLKLLVNLCNVEAVDCAQVVQNTVLVHLTHRDSLVHVIVELFLKELNIVAFEVHLSPLDSLLELKVVVWVVKLLLRDWHRLLTVLASSSNLGMESRVKLGGLKLSLILLILRIHKHSVPKLVRKRLIISHEY